MPLILNKEQISVIEAIKSGKNVVVAGAAGTGKSACIETIRREFPNSIISAMTGSAAANIGGNSKTLHSAIGLGLGLDSAATLAKRNSFMYQMIRDARVLVIDEASMLSAELFEKIDDYLRILMNRNEPFGKIQIVLIGDMRQLPPVSKTASTDKFFFESERFSQCGFETIVLEQNYRQKSDPVYQRILNHASVGELTKEDISALYKRVIPDADVDDATYIYSLRCDVAKRNSIMMQRLAGTTIRIRQIIEDKTHRTSHKTRVKYLMERAIKAASARFDEVLEIKVGAYVMLTVNVEGQFYNGTTGHVVNVAHDSILIRTRTGRVIDVGRYDLKTEEPGVGAVIVSQFPMILAYAFTAHRVQGLTLDKIVVDASKVFSPAQVYVMLSRTKSLDGLIMTKFIPKCVFASEKAKKFYDDAKK